MTFIIKINIKFTAILIIIAIVCNNTETGDPLLKNSLNICKFSLNSTLILALFYSFLSLKLKSK